MANTYTPINTYTLGSSGTITFSSIPNTYSDLIVVVNGGITNQYWDIQMRFNNDSNTNYSQTNLLGDGSTSVASRNTSSTRVNCQVGSDTNNLYNNVILHLINYNSSNYKSFVFRSNYASQQTVIAGGTYRSTSAINTIFIYCGASNQGTASLSAGTTATLYGITAA